MTNKEIRIIFEMWVNKQFGNDCFKFQFGVDGYKDKDLNLMWAGFAAGVLITEVGIK